MMKYEVVIHSIVKSYILRYLKCIIRSPINWSTIFCTSRNLNQKSESTLIVFVEFYKFLNWFVHRNLVIYIHCITYVCKSFTRFQHERHLIR